MIQNIFSLLLAIIGIGFLIFIHELGHYYVARKRKMNVEVFSIGFGRPIYSWMHNGVKWKIGIFPFGGYVLLSGKKEGELEPKEEEIPEKPWDRLLVAFAGPLVNILFAALLFFLLWSFGGRESSLVAHNQYAGWVDSSSELYRDGFRPGDRILSLNGVPFTNVNDLLYASVLKKSSIPLKGEKIFRFSDRTEIFEKSYPTYASPFFPDGFKTIGLSSPASYLIYMGQEGGKEISPFSPMYQSGIQPNDRIVWVDGSLAFSHPQLSSLINDGSLFLTIQRDKIVFHARVPRKTVAELSLSTKQKEEIDDWRFEASLKKKVDEVFVIPYLFNAQLVVDGPLTQEAPGFDERNPYSLPLRKKDRILAVDGEKVFSRKDFLKKIQQHQIQIIVDRKPLPSLSWKETNLCFENFLAIDDLRTIVSSIGRTKPILSSGSLYLLKPVLPTTLKEIVNKGEGKFAESWKKKRQEIDQMGEGEKKQRKLQEWEKEMTKLVLGIPLSDLTVKYNPSPLALLESSTKEMYKTLSSLLTGQLHPKWMTGPLGILQVVQQSWQAGVQETLYWFGIISLNLGFINLLPFPVLDGSVIVLSLFEMITRKRIKPKTLDRFIFPFVILLILFFLFVTYHDIVRIVTRLFHL